MIGRGNDWKDIIWVFVRAHETLAGNKIQDWGKCLKITYCKIGHEMY